ncbi:MAG TPA: hypothetical protein VJ772_06460 [Nitrososphaeraceae archaeon]|nr:hypothetical protein [Nitrososphaeraceae archaeon]
MIKEFLKVFKLIDKEEYNVIKQALDEANIKIESLTEINKSLAEIKEQQKDRNVLEEGFRYDMIRHLHEGIYFKTDKQKEDSIESFAKSKMPIEEITWHLNQIRSFRATMNTTKLPQTSIREKRNDSNFIR